MRLARKQEKQLQKTRLSALSADRRAEVERRLHENLRSAHANTAKSYGCAADTSGGAIIDVPQTSVRQVHLGIGDKLVDGVGDVI